MKNKTYIVPLRGVMPSGKNKIPMARSREVLTKAGFKSVQTYIQSGNARVDTELSAKDIENRVREFIKKHIGPHPTLVVRTAEQLQKVLDENPSKNGHDISRVFFVSFVESPPSQRVKELHAQDLSPEKLAIIKNAGYMDIPGTYGRSILSNNFLEKKLGVSATMHNYNTMSKLIEMSKGDKQ